MQTPTFFPDSLLYCKNAATEDELFSLLEQKPSDLIHFFEVAADDETWTENHGQLMGKLLDWITKQVSGDRLAKELYQRAFTASRKHHHTLSKWMPRDLTLVLADGKVETNSFHLAASSSILRDLLLKEGARDTKNEITFADLDSQSLTPILAYINTGTVPDLKTMSQEDLFKVIRQASAWDLNELSTMAEESLKKYLTTQNCIVLLKKALTERWFHFALRCIEFINKTEWGFTLSLPDPDSFAFEFHNFSDRAIENFSSLQDKIVELICSGSLTDNPLFSHALKSCPEMKTVNISRSDAFTEQLLDIPANIETLNLAECDWLNRESIKKIHKICPNLEKFILSANLQLNYTFWAELTKFTHLRSLDLSFCHQLQDEDLRIIIKGIITLRDLSLGKCDKINEAGFLELAKGLQRLASLDLSRTNVSDTAIVEIGSRCHLLSEINLSSCPRLTEKGILSLVKLGKNLKKIDLTNCNISENALLELSRIKSNLLIIR